MQFVCLWLKIWLIVVKSYVSYFLEEFPRKKDFIKCLVSKETTWVYDAFGVEIENAMYS